MTLMSNDAQKLQDAMMAIHSMWGSPLFIVAVLVLLWQQVGWATLVGLFIMLMLTPFTGACSLSCDQANLLSCMGMAHLFMCRIEELTAEIQSSTGEETIREQSSVARHRAAWESVQCSPHCPVIIPWESDNALLVGVTPAFCID